MKATRKTPNFLPALVAVGGACSLAVSPVSALELGEAQVNSALGQPLRASIAYALNPTEQLSNHCIYLRPGRSGNGIPSLSDARIVVTDSAILLTGNASVREPMINVHVVVDCVYTPHLSREYTLMIDPAAPVAPPASFADTQPVTQALPRQAVVAPVATVVRPARASTPRPATTTSAGAQSPISMNSRYRVQPGDSVSTIIARVQDRTLALWPAVDVVFAANPDAFIDQDVNRLKAGSQLFIPDLAGGADRTVVEISTPSAADVGVAGSVSDPVGEVVPAEIATTGAIEDATVQATPSIVIAPVVQETQVVAPESGSATEGVSLRPGDVILTPVGSGSATTSSQPATGDSQAATSSQSIGAWSWLIWLGGTGIALILGLLLFGRSLRERFGSPDAGMMDAPARRQDDDPTQKNRVMKGVDFEFEDAVNAQAISLDADLGAGTGLNVATDVDVAQDFGFSAADPAHGELDMEITEQAGREEDLQPTDVIPQRVNDDDTAILVSEIPPGDDDDNEEYDLSMIVDATKQPIGDYDATAKDLQAVQVETANAGFDDEVAEYTMSTAVDYQTLEQDYENELTATQALNLEMEEASRELAERIAAESAEEVTREMPAAADKATVQMPTAVDKATVEMPEVSDPDVTAELTANLPTTYEAENDDTISDGSEMTIEMSAAGSDVTVEMQVESGRVDTRKKR